MALTPSDIDKYCSRALTGHKLLLDIRIKFIFIGGSPALLVFDTNPSVVVRTMPSSHILTFLLRACSSDLLLPEAKAIRKMHFRVAFLKQSETSDITYLNWFVEADNFLHAHKRNIVCIIQQILVGK